MEINLTKHCKQIDDYLSQADTQRKRGILDMLDIKIIATPEQVDIKGIIPLIENEATHHSTNIGITT